MEILPKYPIIIELIELREGSEETFFHKARRLYRKPDNTSEYDIKGINRRIPAPNYKHLVNTPKGKLLRLFSPSPDEYYVVPFRKPEEKTLAELIRKDTEGKPLETNEEAATRLLMEGRTPAELVPRFEEDMKSWLAFQVDKSHQDWTKKSFSDKWIAFIMLFIIAILMIANTKISTDATKEAAESAAAAAGSFASIQDKQILIEEKFAMVIDRINILLDQKGVPGASGSTVIIRPPQ